MKGHEAGNQPDDRDLAASSISQLIIFNSKVTECGHRCCSYCGISDSGTYNYKDNHNKFIQPFRKIRIRS